MKVLSFTTLYPNAQQPVHGVFVEQRLRHLLATGKVSLRVVAPVPWFPLKGERWGTHSRLADVPAQETRHGIEITHPRYPVIPKVGMTIAPLLLALAVRSHLARIIEEGYDFDVLDAHYYYPDGVAAAWLARWLNKPFLVTARGTDINLIPKYRMARRMILNSAHQASASITVCQALKDEMVRIGADGAKVHVLRNGVNLAFFKPLDYAEQRRALGWNGRVLLSVGHLIERKGHHLVIDAVARLPSDVRLVIVGEGVERGALTAQIARMGLQDRVSMLGSCTPDRLVQLYSAADALVLASDREGMANVLLESLACGTPVVATAAWGTPEVLADPSSGVLVHERTGEAIAKGCLELFDRYPDRSATRGYAESFSWDPTTEGQLRLFEAAIASHAARDGRNPAHRSADQEARS